MKTFDQFLNESQAIVDRISRNYHRRYPGVNIDVTHHPNTNTDIVNQLWIPPHLRGQGIGTRIMKGLKNRADRAGYKIALTQDPDKGKKAALARFYKSHGFVANRGRKRDFSTRHTHIRYPKEKK